MFLSSFTVSVFPLQIQVLQIWVSLPPCSEGIWGLPMGSAMGWSSDPSHHPFFICFFCRDTSFKTGWVLSPKLKTKGSASVSCGMNCSSHHVLLSSFFSSETNWKIGWVFFPEPKQCGVSHGMTNCPISASIAFFFFFTDIRNSLMSKLHSVNGANLGSFHGTAYGMKDPLWPCTALLFLFQRNSMKWQVSLPSQIKNIGVFLCELWDEMFLSSGLVFAFPLQVKCCKSQ